MGSVKYLSFLLALALASLVKSKKLCSLDDDECLIKGANKIYKSIVAGANGLVEPLDPIHVEKVVGDVSGIKYTVTNSTMTELKNCEVTKLKYDKEDLSFEYNLHCPRIIVYLCDEFKGNLNSVPLDGIVEEKVTLDDYLILFKGKYVLSVSEKDKKPRAAIENYVIDTEPKGKVTFENLKLIRGDRTKMEAAYEFANKNWRIMEKYIKTPLLETFIKTIIDKINIYLKEVPLEDVMSKE